MTDLTLCAWQHWNAQQQVARISAAAAGVTPAVSSMLNRRRLGLAHQTFSQGLSLWTWRAIASGADLAVGRWYSSGETNCICFSTWPLLVGLASAGLARVHCTALTDTIWPSSLHC